VQGIVHSAFNSASTSLIHRLGCFLSGRCRSSAVELPCAQLQSTIFHQLSLERKYPVVPYLPTADSSDFSLRARRLLQQLLIFLRELLQAGVLCSFPWPSCAAASSSLLLPLRVLVLDSPWPHRCSSPPCVPRSGRSLYGVPGARRFLLRGVAGAFW
jgi:hypothetical protein